MQSSKSRLGFHYFADFAHYSEGDLSEWLPVLRAHGARWIVLHAEPGTPIPEPFVLGLLEEQIQPVVWMPAAVQAVRAKQLSADFRHYHGLGVKDIVVFDRPNMRQSWTETEWSRTGLVERFVDRLLPVLQLQRAVGLHPIFPPLEPGGDYWDTAFLETAIQSMLRRGHLDLLRDMRIAVYGWTFGQGLNWGAGGDERWPTSTPYQLPNESQDQRGFNIFDWYAAISSRLLGAALPMIAVAGGALRADSPSHQSYKDQTIQMLRAIDSDRLPESVYAFCVYPFVGQAPDPDADYAWYASPTQPRPIALLARRRFPPDAKRPSVQENKPIHHYWLLSPDARDISQVGLMAQEDEAVIGFSSSQAAMAKKVTLVGPVPASIERKLRKAGAEVSRMRIANEPTELVTGSALNLQA